MKILYLTNTRLEQQWAPTHHVLGFCEAVATQGHAVTLVHPKPVLPATTTSTWLTGERVGWNPRVRGGRRVYHWWQAQSLRRHARTVAAEFDVVYCRFAASEILPRSLARLPIPKAVEVNGADELESTTFPVWIRAVDLVLVDTEPMADIVRARFPDQAAKVAVHVSPATDTRRFVPMDRRTCRAALGLPYDATVLLHVSGFWTHHDFDTAVEALRRLHAAGANAVLVLLGDGPRWHDVRASVDDLIDRRQVVMPGAVPVEQVPRYIGAADVCLNLWNAGSLKRGNLFGFKLYEYVACERPVVETAHFDLPLDDWAKDTLCLIPPESPDAVVQAVNSILSDPAAWTARCTSGLAHVRAHRSWDAAARSTLERIDDLRWTLGHPERPGRHPTAPARMVGDRDEVVSVSGPESPPPVTRFESEREGSERRDAVRRIGHHAVR